MLSIVVLVPVLEFLQFRRLRHSKRLVVLFRCLWCDSCHYRSWNCVCDCGGDAFVSGSCSTRFLVVTLIVNTVV